MILNKFLFFIILRGFMNMMKYYFFGMICSLVAYVHGSESEQKELKREQDIKVILEQTFLKEDRFDKIAAMYVAQAIGKYEENIPVEPIVARLREAMQTKELLKQLMAPYREFSDQEIHQLREIFENETFLKYMEQSFPIIKSNMQVMDQALNSIVKEGVASSETKDLEKLENADLKKIDDSEEAESKDDADQKILEITKDNYHEEVEEYAKPVILDVYADWCRPCRDFSPTFEKLHQEYRQECRFGRVNSEESLLVHYLKISAYPSILFIHKGKIVSREVGNISKDKLEEKIQDFLKDIK